MLAFVLTLAIIIATVESLDKLSVKFESLKDWKLCNNNNNDDSRPNFPYYFPDNFTCWASDHRERPCNNEKKRYEDCQYAEASINNVNEKSLEELFEKVDQMRNVRKVIVRTSVDSFDLLSQSMDTILTPRMWWYIAKESFFGDDTKKSNKEYYEIVIDRYRDEYEAYYRLLHAAQYPSKENISSHCDSSTMIVYRNDCGHPGLAGVIGMYYTTMTEFRYATMGIYVSVSNLKTDSAPFITGSDCLYTMNKWECAFLSTTFCPLPTQLTTCQSDHCVVHIPETKGFATVFTPVVNVVEQGEKNKKNGSREIILHDDPRLDNISAQLSTPQHIVQKQALIEYERNRPTQFSYLLPYGTNIRTNYAEKHFTLSDIESGLFYHYLLRKTAFYRKEINQVLINFSKQENFVFRFLNHHHTKKKIDAATVAAATDRCVAVHIRRGDRVNEKAENMTSFCLEHKDDENWSDHCPMGIPFGSITMEHVIAKAIDIVGPEVTTLLVMTDDEPWLEEQREIASNNYPKYRILHLPFLNHTTAASTSSLLHSQQQQQQHHQQKHLHHHQKNETELLASAKLYREMRFAKGTASGVLLHASLTMMQACEGLIGHSGSEMFHLIHVLMCVRHQELEGICPPTYDFVNGI